MKLSDSNKKDWLLLKKAFKSQWDSITFTFHEIRRESALLNELVLYIPFLVTVIFFVYTNRISHFYHNFGNYGFEENFLSSIQPVVRDLLNGSFRSLSLGLEGPVYPVLLSLKAKISGGDILKNALFLNMIFGTASLFMSYYFLRRLFGTATAAGSLVLIATNVVYFEFTYTACSAPIFLFFTVASVYAAFSYPSYAGRKRTALLLMSGAAGALAALTMLSGVMLFAFFLAALFAFKVHEGRDNAPVKSALLFSAAFLFVFVMAALFIKKTGAVFMTPLPLNETAGGNPLLIHLKSLYFRLFMDISEFIGWWVGVFVILGILMTALGEHTRSQRAFYALGLMIFVSLAFIKYDRFYSFVLLLFYIPLAVNIFGSGAFRRVVESRAAWIFLAAFAGLALFSVFRNMDKISAIARGEPKHLIDIANFIVRETPANSTILSERPLIAGRTGRKHVAFPDSASDMASLLKYAVDKKADYLLADFPEYNRRPFLRFLADPAMRRPFGLREVVRRGYTALYRVEGADLNALRAGEGAAVPFYCLNYRTAGKSHADARRLLKSGFQAGELAPAGTPEYQVVTQYGLQGCVLLGLVFRGPFGELVTANLYAPPQDFQAGTRDGRYPAVLILPGNGKEGKANIAVRNYGENLARNGCYALALDNPGTGERTGFGFSHSRAIITDLASGLAPAHLMVSEALAGRRLLRDFRNADADRISVVTLDEDAFTALYAALLDSTVRQLLFLGGLSPFEGLLFRPEKPIQPLVAGLAGMTTVEDLLRSLTGVRLAYVSFSAQDNGWAGRLSAECGVTALTAVDDNSFLGTNFEKSVRLLLSGAGAGAESLFTVGFRGIPEQENRTTLTIGPENLRGNSPSWAEIEKDLLRVFKPDTLLAAALRVKPLPPDPAAPVIQSVRADTAVAVRKVMHHTQDPVFGSWTEVKRPGPVSGLLVVPGMAADSTLFRGGKGLVSEALAQGFTVCFMPFFVREGGFLPSLREYYCQALYGLPLRALFEQRLLSIRKFYNRSPDYLAVDALSGMAALFLLDQDPAALGRVIFDSFRSIDVEGPFDDVTAGYDGGEGASSHHYEPGTVRASAVFSAYGAKALDDYQERMKALRGRSIFYYPPDDSLWREQFLPEEAHTVFSPDSVFPHR